MAIDDKLREIVADAQGYIDDDDIKGAAVSHAVEAIKQAFADEGWIPTYLATKDHKLMTGQEWYERFEKETVGALRKVEQRSAEAQQMAQALVQAAKRAAGIE